MSLNTHVHTVGCDAAGCRAAFSATVSPGAPDGTAYDQAERLGWKVRKFKPFDPWDDPFAPPEEDRCPPCQDGRGPVTDTGTCLYCGGAATRTCQWCGRRQPDTTEEN
ncbi:hypothetical protein OG618_37620 (plasmid) [Kitasatospora sp. NBC_01246]|uniref:hypothetical protein n=1 Tax=Kitasatospora sp. NBC_01246 TaxID=2903570 RepID=UPI002E32E0E4|nr:hypothetical protein [Kitasatospora sp. NBC_01246]